MNWQPIETAPLDTAILTYSECGVVQATGKKYPSGSIWFTPCEALWTDVPCALEIEEPTHWMPLPPPPA